MRKAILSLFLIFISSSSAQHPYIIFGYVYNEGKVVENAYVNITNERTGEFYVVQTNKDGAYSFVLNNLPSGWKDGDEIRVEARKGELKGVVHVVAHEGEAKKWVNISIGNGKNHPPHIKIDYPQNGSVISGEIFVRGEAGDEDGDVVEIEIKIDEGEWLSLGNSTSWQYKWNTTHFQNGWHKIYARAYDGEKYSYAYIRVIVSNAATHGKNSQGKNVYFLLLFLVAVALAIAIILRKMRK